MSDRYALVTGGAGYIGSHVVRQLQESGWRVDVVDNLSTGHREAFQCEDFFEGCLTDRPFIQNVLQGRQYAAVLHFAAKSIVGESEEDPVSYFQNNVGGTLNLLDAMVCSKTRNLVFSSTAAVYGNPAVIPITETAPVRPVNNYGFSKAICESLVERLCEKGLLNCVVFRYFNAAGAHESGEIGEAHEPESHLIPIILETALGIRPKVQIFGTELPTRDGTCIRDYVHVQDLAEAHVLGIDYLDSNPGFHCFNLGTSNGISVKEIIDAAGTIAGRAIVAGDASPRPGDPAILVASAEKAGQQLDWQPSRSSVSEILTTALRWHRDRRY